MKFTINRKNKKIEGSNLGRKSNPQIVLFLQSMIIIVIMSFNFFSSYAATPKRIALLPFKINAEKEKLSQITEAKKPLRAPKEEEKKPKLIPFKEFQELDLRVGKILKSELVEGSKNLIRLEVDLGEEKPRQILAGMAQYYKPEELEGELVAVIANLAPSKFFGLESRGMVLAAESGKKLAILKPDKKMPPGSKIY